jgi:hypothetical protein
MSELPNMAPTDLYNLIAVISRAVSGRGLGGTAAFAYDFRFYSLVLLGVLIAGSEPSVSRLRESARRMIAPKRAL